MSRVATLTLNMSMYGNIYKLAYMTPMTFTILGKVERMVNWPDLC